MIERDVCDTRFLRLCRDNWWRRKEDWSAFLDAIGVVSSVLMEASHFSILWGPKLPNSGYLDLTLEFDLLRSAKSVDEIAEYLDTEYAIKRVCE